jgi:hypothetical protein
MPGQTPTPGQPYWLMTESDRVRVVRAVQGFEQLPSNRTRNRGRSYPPAYPVLCKNTSGSDWSKGSSATVTTYFGVPGSESAGATISAYNRFGTVKNGDWCFCQFNGWGWYVTTDECS